MEYLRGDAYEGMDFAVAPPALVDASVAAETVNALFSGLDASDMTAQAALDELQATLTDTVKIEK